jgi:dUTP pyrophosphatase
MQKIPVRFKRIDENRTFVLPAKATPGAAAYDIYASLPHDSAGVIVINPSDTIAIPTNLSVEVPQGWELVITPRSGLALNGNISVLNTPGTIDSDYRGEIKVILYNFTPPASFLIEPFLVYDGDRIAQLKIKPSYDIEWVESQNLSMTIRGDHGFGSTGV